MRIPAAVIGLALLAGRSQCAVLSPCAEHREHGRVEAARECYRTALRRERNPRVLAEAYWRLGQRQEANTFFRRATAERPRDAEARVAWGRLFLESHNPVEAEKLFEEALGLDPNDARAHLGLAEVAALDFDEKASAHARRALELDAKLAEARVLLARLALEEKDVAAANGHLEAAEKLPGSPAAVYAMRAAIEILDCECESEWIGKALARNPAYGAAYAVPAHFLVLERRYPEAARLLARAVEIEPELWTAHAELGLNLWRLGDEAGARRHLETAFGGDPFSPTTVNSLRLLDSLQRFTTIKTRRGVLRLHEKEAEVLRPYVEELLDKAVETFEAKYGFRLPRPVQVEVYPDHEDFAVRTLGMPGLGALGVAFGHVVAMDSPSARPPGSFHWGSTLWHELNHVFVIEGTRRRAPRWIAEGLAVYEESLAGPGWGDRLTPEIIEAIREDKLLPIVRLDRGFVRPDYPAQVPVSYFQAGAVCEMIARDWGFPALIGLLRGYAARRSTAEILESELKLTPETFDARFRDYVRTRTHKVVAAFDSEWRPLMKTIAGLRAKKDLAAALEPARRAREMYPDYVGDGNAYEVIADALLEKGDRAGAVDELERYGRAGGRNPETLKKLAGLCVDLGRAEAAREVLEHVLWIRPGDEDLHGRLGDLWLAAGDGQKALREYRSLLASSPLDVVGAHFKLATAYDRLQDRARTREHLLLALEQAPGHRPAQKLLLEIHRR